MPRRKQPKSADEPKPEPAAPQNRPFAEAAAALRATVVKQEAKAAEEAARAAREKEAAKAKKPAPSAADGSDDERALFEAALQGVRPLGARTRERVAPPREGPPSAPRYDEDAEALAKLAAMVEGDEPLGSEFSEEHSEWIDPDADPGILKRLVAGEFAWQDHLDLHGMTREQAHEAIYRFLAAARVKHLRCVLLVHGRGHHSEDQVPVLKLALQRWLRRAPIKDWVFCWATARPVDGGAGAMYVMLRD
ncbi:MAG TPA: Smr/MutS family protein [bacterium]|nr:Smr/MutS family protein [bacterium]